MQAGFLAMLLQWSFDGRTRFARRGTADAGRHRTRRAADGTAACVPTKKPLTFTADCLIRQAASGGATS